MRSKLIIIVLLLMIVGCSSSDDEPVTVSSEQSSEIEEAGAPEMAAGQLSASAEKSIVEPLEDDEPESEDASVGSSGAAGLDDMDTVVNQEDSEDDEPDPTGAVAPSGSVNLGDLTPSGEVTTSEGAAIIQPEPGAPSTQAGLEQMAVQDLAKRLDVRERTIDLLSVEEKDWPDAGLGCPDEDMTYAQVITPGYLFILEGDGQEFEYHTDRKENFQLCVDGRPAPDS